MDIEEESQIKKVENMLRGKGKEMGVVKVYNEDEWEEWETKFDELQGRIERKG